MVRAIVLLSGGLDSSTALAIADEKGYEIVALTFDYGQKHVREIESASKVAKYYHVTEHLVLPLQLGGILKSSLTQRSMRVPKGRSRSKISSGIPSTYVPGRNIIFLAIGASIAESLGADRLIIAANSIDFSGYPYCTPEFIDSFQRMLDVGTKVGKGRGRIHIEAPLLRMSKAEIVREAVRRKVPLELAWSCYSGGSKACGLCDSCILRLEGFAKAGLKDPIEYRVRG